jgi:hypothetical protein
MAIESFAGSPTMTLEVRVGVLKALADPSRLMLVNALLEKPYCVEELAERLRRAPSTVSFHLRKLEEAGLVTKSKTQYYLLYELRPELLGMSLRDFVAIESRDDSPEKRRLARYRQQVLRAFFVRGELRQMPKKWRKRTIVLEEFLAKFEPARTYEEHEVNERLLTLYPDYCTVRRLLIDEGHMLRDGTTYRLAPKESSPMETRSEIKRRYKETPKQAGIYQIKNTVSGKVFLGSCKNLHGPLNRHRFMLKSGLHPNEAMQRDWREQGAEAFLFEVLEIVRVRDEPSFSLEEELSRLERAWIDKLQPFGEHGYNKNPSIRE